MRKSLAVIAKKMKDQMKGLLYPDGSFKSEGELRKQAERDSAKVPVFETPLPVERDFSYWSAHFKERQEQYNEAVERRDHVEISFPDRSLISFIGDTHIGSPDTDYARLEAEIEAIVNTPNSYVCLVGDVVDGFFFNGAQMEEMEQNPEQVRYMKALVRHLGEYNKLLIGWGGDHDLDWFMKMGINPYSELAKEGKAHYMHGVGYLTANVGEQQYRITGAHRLPGSSMYNNNHPQNRAVRFGGAVGSDIVVSGHNHRKGISTQAVQEFGGVARETAMIAIGPYKSTDGYARKLGFAPQQATELYGCAVVLEKDEKGFRTFYDILQAHRDFV